MSIINVLSQWRANASIGGNIVNWHTLEPRSATFAPFPHDLHPNIAEALAKTGIEKLFSHQLNAWELISRGNHIVVATGTSSGKSLCYNLPVLNYLSNNPTGRALYLFPTKALAQDQKTALEAFLAKMPTSYALEDQEAKQVSVATYDGDTPNNIRKAIRNNFNLIFSNPDMLHTGILPHHTNWMEFFSELKFVIIDEIHVYRGVFGSHLANVLRRLKRIANFYGSKPQFILTSATIANPAEHASRLIEKDVKLIDKDGSGQGAKHLLIYNPPIVNRELGIRKSALHECVRLAEDLFSQNIQTLIFARSRRSVELILTYLREQKASNLDKYATENSHDVRGYRSGYLPGLRRKIERGIRYGNVRTVVSTNALELGIDIGGLEAVLLVGYPGTIASTWQQIGRAGRGETPSIAVLISTAAPLDQYLAQHSEYLLSRSPEQALINPDNPLILLDHIRCAAFELPFEKGEEFGKAAQSDIDDILGILTEHGTLHNSGNRYFWMSDRYPAQTISLRSTAATSVQLQTQEELIRITIGDVDRASAPWMVHPGAIYMHEANSYIVESLDLKEHIALLKKTETDYYTEPRVQTDVTLIKVINHANVYGAKKYFGEIKVLSQYTGYRKVKWYTHEQLGIVEDNLPPTELLTMGYWIAIEESTVEALRSQGLWKDDLIDYGPNWSLQRNLARQRDDFRCKSCGIPEAGRSHDVHHKIPFRTYMSNFRAYGLDQITEIYKIANQLDNLVTLCSNCHRRAETAVRVRTGLSGMAYLLNNLAPLSLMCAPSDIGVYSDPVSQLAEGQATVVLYEQIPAGIGFSQLLFETHDELIVRAFSLASTCECVDGCPSCVGPGGEMGYGGRNETLALLSGIISNQSK